jgi:hypothetical protein
MINEALWVKKIYPGKIVILWTLMSRGKTHEDGVLIFQKSNFKHIKQLLQIISESPKVKKLLAQCGGK